MKNLLLRGLAPDGVFHVPIRPDESGFLGIPSGTPSVTLGAVGSYPLPMSRQDFGRSAVVPKHRDVGGRLFTLIPPEAGRYVFCDTIRYR
jgi:hypothetical protein